MTLYVKVTPPSTAPINLAQATPPTHPPTHLCTTRMEAAISFESFKESATVPRTPTSSTAVRFSDLCRGVSPPAAPNSEAAVPSRPNEPYTMPALGVVGTEPPLGLDAALLCSGPQVPCLW